MIGNQVDTTKSLLKSVRHFFSGTMLSRLTGVVRDMTMAYTFGTHSSVAAFFVAFRLAHLFRRILGEGALQAAFIPKFEELRNDSPSRACQFFSDLYGTVSLALIFIIILSICGLGSLLTLFDFSAGNREIVTLTLMMIPSLLFICLFGLNSSILQCEKNYFIPSVAPVFFNLTWISGTLLIAMFDPDSPMYWLAGVIIFACFSQWLITLPKTLSILKKYGFKKPWENFSLTSRDLRLIAKPLFLGVIGVAAAQVNNALDGIFARYADSEGPALLWYAIRIQQVPIGLFAIAFSGALLPPLSRAIKAKDSAKFRHLLKFSIKKCLWVMIPCSLLILLFGRLGIELVYGRGQFDTEAIYRTAQCLYAYTLGLIPMALVLVIAPAFYSQNNYAVPTGASIFSVSLNIGLNALLVMGMGLGAVSVAIATSISAWANFLILAGMLVKNSSLRSQKPELIKKEA